MIRAGAAGGLLSSLLLLSSGGSRGFARAAMAAQRRCTVMFVDLERVVMYRAQTQEAAVFSMNSGAQDAAQTGHKRQATKTGRHVQ